MMASWKAETYNKYYSNLQMYLIKSLCCDGLNKEVYIVNTTGCIHWKLIVDYCQLFFGFLCEARHEMSAYPASLQIYSCMQQMR
jgi:hypothetical protein